MDQEMSRGSVLLLGATSQIGVFTAPRLVAAGFEVTAVSRRPRPRWYPQFDSVQWTRPDALHAGAMAGADMLISAGPIGLATNLIEQCPRLRRAVIFSTSSIFNKLDSHDRSERRQMRDIASDEAVLSRSCESRGIALSLYRPTLVYGCGIDGNVSWLARWIRRFGFVPVAGNAAGRRQPVHADDLAQVAVATLASQTPLVLDVPLCGGSTLSYRQMIEAIFSGLDKPVRIVSVPECLLTAVAYVTRLIPGLQGVRPEMIRRQGLDLVFDDSTPREVLRYDPRPFAPGPREFSLPDQARLRQISIQQ
jgi:nucleoside-diphosphate-sugar epimerase